MADIKDGIIFGEDGWPIVQQLSRYKAIIIDPRPAGSWVCLALQGHAHEASSPTDVDTSQNAAPQVQFAMDPMTAHALGRYLQQIAQMAIAPDD